MRHASHFSYILPFYYFRQVNHQQVSTFLTAGNIKFILLHAGKSEDTIRNFFNEVYELYVKVRTQACMRLSSDTHTHTHTHTHTQMSQHSISAFCRCLAFHESILSLWYTYYVQGIRSPSTSRCEKISRLELALEVINRFYGKEECRIGWRRNESGLLRLLCFCIRDCVTHHLCHLA
jgi:hypothetical protein